MSLESHLHSLRSKPEHVRRHIAFWSSFGITALIFVFWSASFSVTRPSPSAVLSDAIDNANPPLQSMVAAVGSLYESVRDKIFGAKKVEFSIVEVGPGSR